MKVSCILTKADILAKGICGEETLPEWGKICI